MPGPSRLREQPKSILDRELTGETLYNVMERLLKDPDLLNMMHRGALKAGQKDAADRIAAEALAMTGEGREGSTA